jgi:methyl-accepting chemotaxis protein
MTLKHKLFTALGVLGLTLIALAGAFMWSARSSEASLSTVLNDRVLPLKDLKLVADSYAVLIVDSAHKARNGNIPLPDAVESVERGQRELSGAWKRYRATRIEGEEEQLAKTAETTMTQADAAVAKLVSLLRAGDRAALDQFVVRDLYAAVDPVSDAIGKLVTLQIDIADTETKSALATAQTMLLVLILLCVIGAGVLVASILIVTRKVVAPIQNLATAIHALAKDDANSSVPHLSQKDEIGDIARAVDAFLASVVAKERESAAAAAAIQTLVTTTLADGLSALAKGDLTREIRIDFPASYASLKTNFNSALAALRTLIRSVAEGADTIRAGSTEIAQASEDLARRTEANAASLEETSAALTQMDQRLRSSVDAAARTVSSADEAIRVVGDGRALADEAMLAMNRVRESATGIDEVIEGVDKIAFQTRVLAMNAAVEAGRAGEAGRGFAVVADLVSALALRAEEEAQRARDQLTLTQGEVLTAVDAVQRMDGALGAISGGVGAVHKLLGVMVDDNVAQASAVSQISAAVSTMDHATQQNAAMVEQTSAASRSLAGEVDALAEQSARFDTGGAEPGRSAASRANAQWAAAA